MVIQICRLVQEVVLLVQEVVVALVAMVVRNLMAARYLKMETVHVHQIAQANSYVVQTAVAVVKIAMEMVALGLVDIGVVFGLQALEEMAVMLVVVAAAIGVVLEAAAPPMVAMVQGDLDI